MIRWLFYLFFFLSWTRVQLTIPGVIGPIRVELIDGRRGDFFLAQRSLVMMMMMMMRESGRGASRSGTLGGNLLSTRRIRFIIRRRGGGRRVDGRLGRQSEAQRPTRRRIFGVRDDGSRGGGVDVLSRRRRRRR